jgi:hypothetical protein
MHEWDQESLQKKYKNAWDIWQTQRIQSPKLGLQTARGRRVFWAHQKNRTRVITPPIRSRTDIYMETCIYGRHMQECQLYCTTYNRNIQKKEKKKKENRRIQQHDNNSLQQNPQKTKSWKTKQKRSMTFVRRKWTASRPKPRKTNVQ